MRIGICDDNRTSLARLTSFMESEPNKDASDSVHAFENGDDLIRAHHENAFDVVFLDIVMPGINGMEVAHALRNEDKGVRIVFLTSAPEFAVESYKVKASNYLLKPVDSKDLAECVKDVRRELEARAVKRTITVKSARTVHSLNPAEIEHLEARGKHVLIYLHTGKSIESIEPFHALEEKLESSAFICTCRGFLVNANHVSMFTSDEVTLCSGKKVPLSRGRRDEFKDAYFSALFGSEGGAA